jgi:hypothetical protein
MRRCGPWSIPYGLLQFLGNLGQSFQSFATSCQCLAQRFVTGSNRHTTRAKKCFDLTMADSPDAQKVADARRDAVKEDDIAGVHWRIS